MLPWESFYFILLKGKTSIREILLKDLNKSIWFTMQKSHKELQFLLNLRIIKSESCIITDLYCKLTDTTNIWILDRANLSTQDAIFRLPSTKNRYQLSKTLLSWRLEKLKTFLHRQKYRINLNNTGIQKSITCSITFAM